MQNFLHLYAIVVSIRCPFFAHCRCCAKQIYACFSKTFLPARRQQHNLVVQYLWCFTPIHISCVCTVFFLIRIARRCWIREYIHRMGCVSLVFCWVFAHISLAFPYSAYFYRLSSPICGISGISRLSSNFYPGHIFRLNAYLPFLSYLELQYLAIPPATRSVY